jgi:hypothetical protein
VRTRLPPALPGSRTEMEADSLALRLQRLVVIATRGGAGGKPCSGWSALRSLHGFPLSEWQTAQSPGRPTAPRSLSHPQGGKPCSTGEEDPPAHGFPPSEWQTAQSPGRPTPPSSLSHPQGSKPCSSGEEGPPAHGFPLRDSVAQRGPTPSPTIVLAPRAHPVAHRFATAAGPPLTCRGGGSPDPPQSAEIDAPRNRR